jgi:hypothetical protein
VPKTQRPDVGGVGPRLAKRFIQRQPQSSSKAKSPKQGGPVFTLTGIHQLRSFLKAILRQRGLRCVDLRESGGAP